MRVVGFMSGTSLDGLSIGYVKIDGVEPPFSSKFIAGRTFPLPESLRVALLKLAQSGTVTSQIVANCNRELGVLATNSLEAFLRDESLQSPELIGFHGQTIYHQPSTDGTTTLQIGDPSPLCSRFNVPVVSDFRSMDTAVNGQGAPLVSVVDYLKYRSDDKTRVILNLGGISNVTVLPRGCDLASVLGFDVGPGNMLIDAVVDQLTYSKLKYDAEGEMASRGSVSKELLDSIMQADDYRYLPYPKTTGRERYGLSFVEKILSKANALKLDPDNVVATTSHYTVFMITYHLKKLKDRGLDLAELIIGGGGSRNKYVVQELKRDNPELTIKFHNEYGVPSSYWESYAFAVLSYLSHLGFSGNVPSVTGASRPVLLGRVNLPARHILC